MRPIGFAAAQRCLRLFARFLYGERKAPRRAGPFEATCA